MTLDFHEIGRRTAPTAPSPEGPQPLLREIPPGSPYPVEALGPLKRVVQEVQMTTQAPVAIAAQSALSIASLAVQPFANVETLGGPSPVSLFCLTVAGSGERKSTSDKMLMAGVRNHEKARTASYVTEKAEHDLLQRLWTSKRDAIIKGASRTKPRSDVEIQADLEALGVEPQAPLLPNTTATEPTLEGLAKLFISGQPSLGLFSDEGGAFLGGHAMNSENRLKTSTGLSTLWDGEPFNRTRAGDGAVTLYGRRLAVHLMMQPVAAHPFLSDPLAIGQGILARFLICEPASTIGTRFIEASPCRNVAEVAAFERKIEKILAAPKPTAEHSPQELAPRDMRLSDGAMALLVEYSNAIEAQQARGGELELLKPFASKSAEQAARIAGVLSLWENLDAQEVELSTMQHGIDLAQYYLMEAKRLTDAALISAETAKAERLRLWLLESWPTLAKNQSRTPEFVLPRDVTRCGPASIRETKDARQTLAILEGHGWVEPLPKGASVDGASRDLAYRIVRG